MTMMIEGCWDFGGPVKKEDGPAPKGQTQAPVAPNKQDTIITAPKVKFGPRK